MRRPLASGARLEIYDQIDSTSREARRRAEAGEQGPLWIVANRQTNGYGRRGAAWIQSEGDVAATLLFSPQADPERLPQLSLVAAVALADALGSFAPDASFALKWPNDVLLGGGKIAGLLSELVAGPRGRVVCLGLGVNVVSRPEGVEYPTARLADAMDPPPAPLEFVARLDERLASRLAQWAASGFAPARADWLALALHRPGAEIVVRAPHGQIAGKFLGIDEDGAALIGTASGVLTVRAGAVAPPAAP